MRKLRSGGLALALLLACSCSGGDDNAMNDGSPNEGGGQDGTMNKDTGVGDTGVMDMGVMDMGVMDMGVTDTGGNEGGGGDGGDGGSMDAAPDGPILVDGGIVCDKMGSPWHYLVDPVNGDDTLATGSGTSGNFMTAKCAFKTVTKAIATVLADNNPPNAGTQIIIVGPSTVSVAANGETFPLNVPKNTLVTSMSGTVTVKTTSGDMFKLAATGSGLSAMTLDGSSNTGARAVVAGTGTDTTDTISTLVVTNFASDCVAISGTGALTVTDGVSISGCGTSNARASGIHATDSAHLVIKPANTATVISKNTLHGIQIEGTAHADITSTLGNSPPSTALVQLDANAQSGIFIQQTPNPNNTPPLSTIDGVASGGSVGINNAGGDGIAVYGGSQLKLRNSWVLKNLSNGVQVATYPQNVTGASDVTGIDLGASSNDWGKNRVQDQTSTNGAAGICLNLSVAINTNLAARGNFFATNIDCTSMNTMLTKGMCAANSKTHVGVAGSQLNVISTTMCTN